jgi:large subunit ribosomal protein L18
MAKGASYRVKLRRRREGKTDYQARKAMVICSRPRLVTRPSIRNINAQIIVAKQKGDLTLVAASSHELVKKYGWKAPTGNIPAAYLTGMLVGLRAKAKGINEAILDLGLINPTKGSRVFAVLHGAIDAGVEIPHGEEKIVKDRAKGDHIAYYAKSLSGEQEEYAAKFSQYTAKGLAPEKVAQHFSEVRVAIIGSFKDAKVAPEPPSAAAPKAKAPPKPAPKPEAKVVPAPKAEAKAPEAKPASAPKVVAPVAAKVEVKPAAAKVEEKAAPKAEAKPAPKTEAKAEPEAKPKAKATKEKAAPAKAKPVKEKATGKEKAAPKEKSTKEKAPAKKAPAKKATKKGEQKE